MRIQFVPLPRMKPLQPSSLHILPNAWPTDNLYASRPALCICIRILSLSSGDTTVRETAPATPPPQKAATIGWDIVSRNCIDQSLRADGFIASGTDYTNELVAEQVRMVAVCKVLRTADMMATEVIGPMSDSNVRPSLKLRIQKQAISLYGGSIGPRPLGAARQCICFRKS
jgi:hypothetical protein